MKQEQLQAIHDELKEVLERHPLPWKYNFKEEEFAVTDQWIEIEDQEISLGGDATHEFGYFVANSPVYILKLMAEIRRLWEALKEIETELYCNADLRECLRNIGRLVEKGLYAERLNSCVACNGSGQVKMLSGIVPCPVCRQALETQND